MAVFKLGPYKAGAEMSDSDSEDDVVAMKRKSLIMLEQSLDIPCDDSPLDPRTMREVETKPASSLSVEKMLLERVMLRKELKLRSVQEMLVDTSHKLEQAEQRIQEYETLPLFRQYVAWCGLVSWSQEEAGAVTRSIATGLSLIYQMFLVALGLPCWLFHQLPASVQLLCVSMVAHMASVVGESAENYTNECRERTEDSEERRNRSNVRRRRRS